MEQVADAVVVVSFDGDNLLFSPLSSGQASRAVIDPGGNIYILADISPAPVKILFLTQQEGLEILGIAAWPVFIEPVQKIFQETGPIFDTPFSLERNKGSFLLTDDHKTELGSFTYWLKFSYRGEIHLRDPEIENRGESGWPPEFVAEG